MTHYEVWSEGYSITSNRDEARLLISGEFESFDEAVRSWADTLEPERRKKHLRKGEDGIWRDWGCRLFDNETDARKMFG